METYTVFVDHVYLWRIHFDIWQNQYNIVKLKNKIKLKKRINIAKIKILPKTIYWFNANPIKITNGICHRTKTYNTEICMNTPKTLKSQNNLEEEEQTRCITFPDFKLYYKAIVIKMVWCWHKNRHTDQWYRKELRWHAGGKNTQWGKDRFLSKWCWVT